MGALTASPVAGAALPEEGRRMTRCECAGLPFGEVERRLREEQLSLDEIGHRTGCGRTCTACLPDLRAFLLAR